MSFADAVDRLNRACERRLGGAITVDSVAGQGVYYAPFEEAFGVASSDPRVAIRRGALTVSVGSALVCAAGTFRVRKIEPDGTGWDVLRLEAA